jgi:hypothetical protein
MFGDNIDVCLPLMTRYLDGGGGRVGRGIEQPPLALDYLAARGLLDALHTPTPTHSTMIIMIISLPLPQI